jgi:glyoxylase-like metal-dependent hydrolase (beta-lactamase superfamily II)
MEYFRRNPLSRPQSRRQLLKSALGGAAGVLLGASAFEAAAARSQDASGGVVEQLGDNLFVIRIPGEANVVARTGGDGVLLVDGASSAAADRLLDAIADLPGTGRVRTLFNTHWHPEQTGLNERVGGDQGTIIAQENTRLWLTTDITWPWDGRRFEPLPRIAQPNESFYTNGEHASGVRYGYVPDAAHTDGDLYVYFPEENVLAVGGAVSGDGWPLVDWWTGGWIGGIVGGVNRLIALSDAETRVVPSNGPVLGLADLEAQAEMYSTIYGRLSMLLNSGRGPEEAVEAGPTAEFDAVMGDPDEFVRRAFESQWAYVTPDA